MGNQDVESQSTVSSQVQGPVGQGDYVVQRGQCLMTISMEQGFFWKTIWNHPDNAELRAVREDPRVLVEGDRVTIPDKRLKEESGPTEQRHRYRRRGVPPKLRLQFMKAGEPRQNEPYTAEIDGQTYEGMTDGDGMVEIPLPKFATRGLMRLGAGEEQATYELNLGELDPYKSVVGIKQRLRNMGFYTGEINSECSDDFEMSLRAFQESQDLPVTGQPDKGTCEELKKAHGS